jgi:G3E family GTPase
MMPVSIVAGPAATAAVEMLTRAAANYRITFFTAPPSAEPEELIRRLTAIAEKGETDRAVIQCEADRPAMAYASLFVENDGVPTLAGIARLTGVAFAIEPRAILDLPSCFIAEQLEFATDIFLQAASENEAFELARSIALTLNPRAAVTLLNEATIDAWVRSSACCFDFAGAVNNAGWRQLLEGSSSAFKGVTAFPYRARRPFHPGRFWKLLEHGLAGVFRAKGFFWLATRMDEVGGLNLAGPELYCSSAGKWWAARDDEIRKAEMPERTRKEWQEPFGDRRQSFAVMSLDIEPKSLQDRLDACLLTDSEMAAGENNWSTFADPFPSWAAHAHVHHHGECDHEHGDEHECCRH